MVGECANPSCNEKFKYLGEGKLFLANPIQGLQMSRQQLFEQCHWLCKHCSKHYSIEFDRGFPQLVSLGFTKAANF